VLSHVLLALIVAFSIVLMLVRPRGIPEVYWIGGGALLLVVLRLVPLRFAGTAVAEGSDVYLFLIGMMLLSELAREHGVFDWLSSVAVHSADGSTKRLFALVYGIGTLVTIFMSNDATAVVLTPAILTVVRKAKVQPLPYLFACAFIANAASFVLPISNPANLVVFHQGMPPLGRWLLSFGVPSLLSIASTYAVMRLVFRKDLSATIEETVEAKRLDGNGKMVLAGLGLLYFLRLLPGIRTSACRLAWPLLRLRQPSRSKPATILLGWQRRSVGKRWHWSLDYSSWSMRSKASAD
jgi:arsenical pump membrane protein